MFDHLVESSQRDDSNKWSNIGFGQEIKELASIEIHFTHLIGTLPCASISLIKQKPYDLGLHYFQWLYIQKC